VETADGLDSMKKIPNLFERDWQNNPSRILPVFNKTADVTWIFTPGLAVPTVKWDGTAVLVRDSILYCRFDAKHGKTPPANFVPCQEADPKTGHHPGWMPAEGPQYQWHMDAFNCARRQQMRSNISDGTYEAIGRSFGGNPYELECNTLVRHGEDFLKTVEDDDGTGHDDFPVLHGHVSPECAHVALAAFFQRFKLCMKPIEGVVFHEVVGERMVKVLSSDLGVPWIEKKRKSPPAQKQRA
jgi:hypothetical protein